MKEEKKDLLPASCPQWLAAGSSSRKKKVGTGGWGGVELIREGILKVPEMKKERQKTKIWGHTIDLTFLSSLKNHISPQK